MGAKAAQQFASLYSSDLRDYVPDRRPRRGKARSGRMRAQMDVNRWVMTRIMQTIGDKARNGTPGLGLVTIKRTKGYPTRTEVFLTEKGRAIAAQVFQGLRLS